MLIFFQVDRAAINVVKLVTLLVSVPVKYKENVGTKVSLQFNVVFFLCFCWFLLVVGWFFYASALVLR